MSILASFRKSVCGISIWNVTTTAFSTAVCGTIQSTKTPFSWTVLARAAGDARSGTWWLLAMHMDEQD